MASVLKLHATQTPFADAFARLDFAAVSDVYFQFRFAIPDATLSNIASDGGIFDIFGMVAQTPAGGRTVLFNTSSDLKFLSPSVSLFTPVADTWYEFDLHWTAGSPPTVVVQVDGTEIYNATVAPNGGNAIRALLSAGSIFDVFNNSGDADYTVYFDDYKIGTTGFGSSDIFDEDFEGPDPLGNFTITGGDATIVSDPFPPPTSSGRFFDGYPWRFIVTDLNSETQTLLDRLCTNRRVVARLGAAWEASGTLPSDSPEVNILRALGTLSDDPFVQEGISLVYGFRRESDVSPKWICRFGGLLLRLEDNADTDLALSNWTAWDPWMYLYSRPVRDPDTGNLPGQFGLSYDAPADEIAIDLLVSSGAFDGEHHIDESSGQLDPCETVQITFQRGASVGEALDDLMATNTCEIMLTPVYDPINRPGIVAELNVAPQLGQQRNDVIMAWDKPSRSLTGLNRLRDGTRRTNEIQYYAGQGGRPVAEYDDATSVATFGVYYEQMFIVGKETDETESDALRALALRSYGEVTYRLSPATARSVDTIALLDYEPGDSVPVYASSNFREELGEVLRVMEIPIEITDNAEEQVRGMLAVPVPTTSS